MDIKIRMAQRHVKKKGSLSFVFLRNFFLFVLSNHRKIMTGIFFFKFQKPIKKNYFKCGIHMINIIDKAFLLFFSFDKEKTEYLMTKFNLIS